MICKRAAGHTGDPHFVDDYRDLIVRMLDDLFATLLTASQAVLKSMLRVMGVPG